MGPPQIDAERLACAAQHERQCTLCEHRCGVDRTTSGSGAGRGRGEAKCHAPAEARVFRHRVEWGEESFLNPCHLFYLSGCDLRCVFCINGLSAFDSARGQPLTQKFFQESLVLGRAKGAKTLQWVGGEPTIHLPAILRAMAGVNNLPPVVWKSDFHFTPEALDLLTGVVDVFVADFKFGNDRCARRLSGVRGYLDIVTRNLLAARTRARLVVRHLLLPGHEECCWRPIASWLAKHLPEVEVSIRGGYLPHWRAAHFPELATPLLREAYPAAVATARHFALRVIT
jgi:putative pyruvate formate lyase activating enzyme